MIETAYIYVDDERIPEKFNGTHPNYWTFQYRSIVKNYDWAIDLIEYCRKKHFHILLDLDHDLGEEKTGYDICKYVVENQIKDVKYRIHSMNPVGRANMEQLMSHYGYKKF